MQIKSINKMQRDSIGENNVAASNENEGRHGGMMQQTPNFYEFPTGSKQAEGAASTLGMPGNSYDNQ